MKQSAHAPKEIARLWVEFKTEGSATARDALILQYLGLVKHVAGRIAMNAPSHIEEDELIGWGVLGLLDAIEKFDLSHNASFETYASLRIRGAILDHIRSLDWAPRSLRQKARQLDQAAGRLKEQLGREPAEAELAAEMTMSEDELFELMTEIHGAYIISLDAVVSGTNDSEEATVGQLTPDSTIPLPDESASRKELEERIAKAIEGLAPNERHVITLYYYDELTLKEIGAVLGLTESRVCQIHRAVIKKMGHVLKAGV